MSDELEEFTSQLNAASHNAANVPPMPSANAAQPQISVQQAEAQRIIAEKSAALLAMPLKEEELKGKVDLKYYGHSGFKISFKDAEDKLRCIYINICSDNPNCPEEDRKQPPNDCDLALVTQGQLQHSMHAPFLI